MNTIIIPITYLNFNQIESFFFDYSIMFKLDIYLKKLFIYPILLRFLYYSIKILYIISIYKSKNQTNIIFLIIIMRQI